MVLDWSLIDFVLWKSVVSLVLPLLEQDSCINKLFFPVIYLVEKTAFRRLSEWPSERFQFTSAGSFCGLQMPTRIMFLPHKRHVSNILAIRDNGQFICMNNVLIQYEMRSFTKYHAEMWPLPRNTMTRSRVIDNSNCEFSIDNTQFFSL